MKQQMVRMKRCLAIVVMVALIGSFLQPLLCEDIYADENAFEEMRRKWCDLLTGGENDTTDFFVQELITARDNSAWYQWQRMTSNTVPERLFPDLDIQSSSAAMTGTYTILRDLAIVYQTKGCSLYQNQDLKTDLVSALDFMYDTCYNENTMRFSPDLQSGTNNWWDWEIGSAQKLNDIKNASGLISKLAWYDLLKSIKPEAPVVNSEDHIIEDRNTNYTKKRAVHVAADIWQGAVHGRDASIIWIWGRTQDKTANTYGNILYRPDVLSAVGKKSLDLNRLSEQVASLQKAENKVTILYSPTSRAYSQNTIRTLLYAYESALYAGANPKFITERQLAAGVKPEGTLILPEVRNVSVNVYAAIENYQKQGGKLMALGEECLLYDEYNRVCQRTIDFDRTVSITRSGTVISQPTKAELQLQIVETTGITDFLRDANGKAVTEVERIEQKTAAGSLWNLCNYTWETSKQVCFEGKAVDLLTGTIYEGQIELQPFVPVLLEFGNIRDAEFISCITGLL